MALGYDDEFVFWSTFEELSTDICEFVSAPYDILIGSDGNQISQLQWVQLPSTTQKLDCIYRTVAVNKARKALGLSSLKELRYEKNTEAIAVTALTGPFRYVVNEVERGDITLIAGKRYQISFPGGHPLRLSKTEDGRGSEAVEFTEGVSIAGNTLTIDVTNVTTLPEETLYYYCDSHAEMGGQIIIDLPYNEYVAPLVEVEGQNVKDEDTEFQEGTMIYDHTAFNSLVVGDIEVEPSSFTSEQTTIAASLFYLPTNDGSFNTDISQFKGEVYRGRVFVDSEDAIDEFGNRIEETREELYEGAYPAQHALAFGPTTLPVDLEGELNSVASEAREAYWKKVKNNALWHNILFQPPTYSNNGQDLVSQVAIKSVSHSHAILQFSAVGESQHTLNGVFFDDLNCLLNIKDPAYGCATNGTGGQDLSKLQKIRKCLVIDDAGTLGLFEDAVFAVSDIPKGAIFFGDFLVPTVHSYLPKQFDAFPRLVLSYYGSDVTNLNVNNNLAYRIYNDFTRLEWADPADDYPTVAKSDLNISAVKSLSPSWSSAADLPDHVGDCFYLRSRDGTAKGSAFLKNNSDLNILRKPQYVQTTITSSDLGLSLDPVVSFTYRVLAPNEHLNLKRGHFGLHEQEKFYILDEYSFNVNDAPMGGPAAKRNIFYYNPPQIA